VPTPPPTDPPKPPEVPTPGPTDPSGDPTDPNDPTDPTMPTTPGGDQEETVTIQDGDRQISVTSPDGQGQVKVTVDDGTGPPKSYTLDFGAADATTLPGTPGQPGQQPVATGDFGPNGEPPTAPGPDAPIEPGPDGTCVITDGDLTITAERPDGQSDTVVVTVDDGTGNPTTYNHDYSDATTPTDTPGTQQVGGDLGQPAVGAMPQELVDANQQVDQADFTPDGDQVSTQPAYGEAPASLQGDQVGTQPAFGEAPASLQGDQVSTQPAYGDPAGQQSHAFATTASAADDPTMSGFADQGGSGGQAGSFGVPDGDPSPYMQGQNESGGEAGLPSADDADGADDAAPGDQSGQDQAHPGTGGGGMPMMGGAPGGGGGGGGDGERAGTQWRTTGDLFDEPADPQRLSGAFGVEGN